MLMRMGMASVIVGLMTLGATADEVQWNETQNIGKGVNFPEGVTGDILGIEIGDSYADAKAKLEAVKAETPPLQNGKPDAKIIEFTDDIFLPLPNGTRITASSVGSLKLERSWIGAGSHFISETLTIWLSAPSSGHQVQGVERLLNYHDNADHVSIPDMLAKLEQKFGAKPLVRRKSPATITYLWRYDGRQLAQAKLAPADLSCEFVSGGRVDQDKIDRINANGTCDAKLEVQFSYGLSEQHAKSVRFQLFDLARMKSNYDADFAFFDTYVEALRSKPAPATPRL